MPGRCIGFARQGCVAFSWDMIGYNDSFHWPHRQFRPPAAWNGSGACRCSGCKHGTRSVPWISCNRCRRGCEPHRLHRRERRRHADNGHYRRGRPHQGRRARRHGQRDHAGRLPLRKRPNLRQDIFNVEVSAAAAPRPQLLISATGDWTRFTLTSEYPAVRSIYQLYGAADKVEGCVRMRRTITTDQPRSRLRLLRQMDARRQRREPLQGEAVHR